MTPASILTRLRKLLRTSRDQAGTPEGDTARALADKLASKHSIPMADVDPDAEGAVVLSWDTADWPEWKLDLAVLCVERSGLDSGYDQERFVVKASRERLDALSSLFAHLVLDLEDHAAASAERRGLFGVRGGQFVDTRFCPSAVLALHERMVAPLEDVAEVPAAESSASSAVTPPPPSLGDDEGGDEGDRGERGGRGESKFLLEGYMVGRSMDLDVPEPTLPRLTGDAEGRPVSAAPERPGASGPVRRSVRRSWEHPYLLLGPDPREVHLVLGASYEVRDTLRTIPGPGWVLPWKDTFEFRQHPARECPWLPYDATAVLDEATRLVHEGDGQWTLSCGLDTFVAEIGRVGAKESTWRTEGVTQRLAVLAMWIGIQS